MKKIAMKKVKAKKKKLSSTVDPTATMKGLVEREKPGCVVRKISPHLYNELGPCGNCPWCKAYLKAYRKRKKKARAKQNSPTGFPGTTKQLKKLALELTKPGLLIL